MIRILQIFGFLSHNKVYLNKQTNVGREVKHRSLKSWAVPLLVQIVLCSILSLGTFWIDKQCNGKAINAWLSHFFTEDAGILANVLGGLTQVAPAILGIAITVIAIIVEMASNKYSPKVMDLFVNDHLNFWAMALFVITSVNSIWVAHILTPDFFPIVSIIVNGILVSASLLLVIPYFNHIFTFLHPHNFITYVKEQTISDLGKLQYTSGNFEKIDQLKSQILNNIDFIGDIAINSVIQGDRAVSQYCCTNLTELMIAYLEVKESIPDHFFNLTKLETEDPDFIDFSSFVMLNVESRKIWIERKMFRQLEIIFTIARENLKTVASGVLLNSVKIGQRASEKGMKEVVFTVIQYFNTFLRFAINSGDPRTAFNILEHYRNYGAILMKNMPSEVANVVFYFKYYALEAQRRQVLFILETAAADICRLNELAFELNLPSQRELLDQFLKLDQPIEEKGDDDVSQQEKSLMGVRIAQVKLAGFYLTKGREDLARIIYEDMHGEPYKRIHQIHEMIEMNTNEEFYEITGRGVNFFFVSAERRTALREFFSWFEKKN